MLDVDARLELIRSMLDRVLTAATAAESVDQVIVLSPERDRVADKIPLLTDTGESLNAALAQAREALWHLGCATVVVLPADLPLLRARDVDALVRAARTGGCAIAPDLRGTGTNGLCLPASYPFSFQFGDDSRRLHLLEARRLGLGCEEVRRAGLSFDIDLPADLMQWEASLYAEWEANTWRNPLHTPIGW